MDISPRAPIDRLDYVSSFFYFLNPMFDLMFLFSLQAFAEIPTIYHNYVTAMEHEIFFYDSPASLRQEGRSTAGLEAVPCDTASVSWENPPPPMYETPVRSYSPSGSYSGAGSVTSKTSDTSRRRRGLRSPAHSTASSKQYI